MIIHVLNLTLIDLHSWIRGQNYAMCNLFHFYAGLGKKNREKLILQAIFQAINELHVWASFIQYKWYFWCFT